MDEVGGDFVLLVLCLAFEEIYTLKDKTSGIVDVVDVVVGKVQRRAKTI